jgi:hypothetical protein
MRMTRCHSRSLLQSHTTRTGTITVDDDCGLEERRDNGEVVKVAKVNLSMGILGVIGGN